MGRARQAVSLLDPTGIRPTAIVAGLILALFFGAQLVNALIPVPQGPGPGGPGTGPISGPGQPGQTLPPIVIPTGAPVPGTTPGPFPGPTAAPVPGAGSIEAGPLRIPLESGWQAEAAGDNVIVRLFKGSIAIDLVKLTVEGGAATPAKVHSGYIQFIGDGVPGFTAIPPANIQVGGTIPAVRGSYSGGYQNGPLEGDVTAFVTSDTTGWVWDIWAPAGTLQPLLAEARRMIDNVRVVQ